MSMASLQTFPCSQYKTLPTRFSRYITRSSLQSDISRPTNYGNWNWRAAPFKSIVSSPTESSPPKTLDNLTDGIEALHEIMLKEARRLVGEVEKSSFESLLMMDSLQRLGIDHHFKSEMQSILQEQNLIITYDNHPRNSSLFEVALRFRLLRQEGYYVPADIFKKFKSKENKCHSGNIFDPLVCKDVFGLISLYEASHLGIEGEDILDEAANFTRGILSSSAEKFLSTGKNDTQGMSSQTVAELVKNTLSNPFHKSLPRFTRNKTFLAHFEGPYEWTRPVTEVALLETDLIAAINRTEIQQVTRWWNDLKLEDELKFARNQPVKWYVWPMAVLSDPNHSEERIDLTKPVAMVYIIDDIFDVKGSLDELFLFTESIRRWDCAEELPEYMKACFRALDKITNEISFKVLKRHGWNPTDYLRKSWASLFEAFLVERRWFTSDQTPSADDYLKNAIVSSGVPLVMDHMFTWFSENPNERSLEMLNASRKMSSLVAKILRLWDDLGCAKDEDQQGHDGSYVDFYINENPGCSVEGAREHAKEMISAAWKSLNRECLTPPFLPFMAKASLDTVRMVPLMYNYDENHSLPRIEEYMKSLLLSR